MGKRTKGNMWCKRCGPVLGVKNTHKVRNTGALLGSLALPGAFIFGKVEGYYCPICGGKVSPAWMHGGNGRSSRGTATVSTTPDSEKDEAYWDNYVRGLGYTPKAHGESEPMTTPDGKWVSHDGGEHFVSALPMTPEALFDQRWRELQRLSKLHRKGVLSDEEFAARSAQQTPPATPPAPPPFP